MLYLLYDIVLGYRNVGGASNVGEPSNVGGASNVDDASFRGDAGTTTPHGKRKSFDSKRADATVQ